MCGADGSRRTEYVRMAKGCDRDVGVNVPPRCEEYGHNFFSRSSGMRPPTEDGVGEQAGLVSRGHPPELARLLELESRVDALERRTIVDLLLPASMAHQLQLVVAVTAYMAASAGMMVINKLVLRSSHLPITVVIIQMLFTVVVLFAAPGMRRAIHFGSVRDSWRWARAVPPLFALMLVSSMLALDFASMGALVVVRNLAPVPTLMAEMVVDRSMKVDAQTMLAILFSICGVLLYARNDLHSSYLGLMFMAVNLFAAVAERVVQRKLIALDPIDVSKQGMMLLNNGVGAVLLVPLTAFFGETAHLHELASLDKTQCGLLLLSCVNGVAISYAGIHVQKYVSASTFIVLTNTNKFAVIAFGIFVLGEARAWQAVLGCVVALAGGLWYGKARAELEAAAKEAPPSTPAHAGDPNEEEIGPTTKPSASPPYLQAAAVLTVLLFALSGAGAPADASRPLPPPSAPLAAAPLAAAAVRPSTARPRPAVDLAATPASARPSTVHKTSNHTHALPTPPHPSSQKSGNHTHTHTNEHSPKAHSGHR